MKNNTEKYRKPFEFCALSLLKAAQVINPYWPGGMDYKKINVILFCFILPAILAGSIGTNLILLRLLMKAARH